MPASDGLKKLQDECPDCIALKQLLHKRPLPMSNRVLALFARWCGVVNGVVVATNALCTNICVPVAPTSLRRDILFAAHGAPRSAYLGTKR